MIGLAACTSSSSQGKEGAPVLVPFTCPDLAADGKHQVVAIIDRGFDLSLPVFQGKIAGCYTVTCADAPAQTRASDPPTFEHDKATALAELPVKDTRCHLVPGITLRKSARLDIVAEEREAWNAAILAHTAPTDAPEVAVVLGGEDSYSYHGTWTSSIIAYDNPGVRIVFIENDGIKRANVAPECASRAAIERSTALLQDPEIRAAGVTSPVASLDDDYAALYRHHGVTLQNKSFGQLPLAKVQETCPDVADAYAANAAIEADVAGAEEHAHNDKEYAGVALVNVRASGNEGKVLATMADRIDCPSDPRNVPYGAESFDTMIGSYGTHPDGSPRTSAFSNTGACVTAYAPGEHIVAISPGGFLTVVSGTSFAAPLVVRHLSLLSPGTTPKAMRATLAETSDLPVAWFPPELIYDTSPPGTQIRF